VDVPIPVHLAVHVLGLAVAAGLVAAALLQGRGAPGRAPVAVGAGLLAVSHLLIGGLWAEPVGAVLLLRTAGYAAFAVGAIGAAGQLTGGVAAVTVLPPALHLTAALAGFAAATTSARGVLGRGRDVLPLAAGLALWAGGDLLSSASPLVAATTSLLGSVALAVWVLLRAGARSLMGRVAGAFVAVLLVLTVGLAGASGLVFSADLRTEQVERLAAVAGARAADLAETAPRELEGTAALLTGQVLADEVAGASTPDALDGRASTISALPGVEVVVLLDGEGGVVGSSRGGEPLGPAGAEALAGDELTAGALGGELARGLVRTSDGELVAVGVAPVAPRDDEGQLELDRQVGALLVGRPVTTAPELERIARDTATDVAVLADGRVLGSTLPRSADPDVLAANGDGQAPIAGERRLVVGAPLAGAAGPPAGQLVLALPSGSLPDAADTAVRSTFLVAALGLFVAIGLAVPVSRRVTGPVARLTVAAERIARGELHTRVATDRDDEVGRLAGAFDEMAVALDAREQQLRTAAAIEAGLRGRLEAITGSMGDALLAAGADGRLLMANPAATRLLGQPAGDLLGRRASEALPVVTDVGASLIETLDALATDGPVTVRGRTVDGERVVLGTAAPLIGGDREVPDGRVYVLRDVTDQVRAERLKTEIVANVSHELRTPLTPIRGYLELLRQRELPSAQVQEFAAHGAGAAERLQRTVDALIDLADLEAGRATFEVQPTELSAVVGPVVERWREREPDRSLIRRVPGDLPLVAVDGQLLERALDQLVDNAMKFSTGTVQLSADHDEGRVRLSIRDEGVGIPEERLVSVLDDFEQVDGSATRHTGGLGVGLSIVQRVLARLDARFELESTPGRGTEAGILLPVVGADARST
jgi:PAS domain S-box-containing protein